MRGPKWRHSPAGVVVLMCLMGHVITAYASDAQDVPNVSEYDYLPTGKGPVGLAGSLLVVTWRPSGYDHFS